MASLQRHTLCSSKRGNSLHYTIKSIMTTVTIFLFLILMVHIQPGSLLKLPSSSSSFEKERSLEYQKEGDEKEERKVNKVMLSWRNPDAKTVDTTPQSASSTTTTTAAHYSQKPFFVENKEKSAKTNSFRAVHNTIQDDLNEEAGKSGRTGMGENNDVDDGKEFPSAKEKTKTTIKPSTFDLTTITITAVTSPPAAAPNMSKVLSKNRHERTRNTRSLKNDTKTPKKRKYRLAVDGGGDGSSRNREKNHYDKYHDRITQDGREEEAIESFQKAFVNGNDVSVSEAVAFGGMDMGILEKFQKKQLRKIPETGTTMKEMRRKSEDKKDIQVDEQLSPSSDLGGGNNDIQMQGTERLIFTTATSIPDGRNSTVTKTMHPEDNNRVDVAARLGSVSREQGSEENIEIANRKKESIDGKARKDDNDETGGLEEEFDKIVEGAPEGIDSTENISSFYHFSDHNNNNNNLHHEHRRHFNQSARLTFASFADFDKVGSSKTGGGGNGDGSSIRPDFVELAASTSTASADEVKLYRLVQRLLKESPLIDG